MTKESGGILEENENGGISGYKSNKLGERGTSSAAVKI